MPDTSTSRLHRSQPARHQAHDHEQANRDYHGDPRERSFGSNRNREIDERRRYETHGHTYDEVRRHHDDARRASEPARGDYPREQRQGGQRDERGRFDPQGQRHRDDRQYAQPQDQRRNDDRRHYEPQPYRPNEPHRQHDDRRRFDSRDNRGQQPHDSRRSADWGGAPAPYDARRWDEDRRWEDDRDRERRMDDDRRRYTSIEEDRRARPASGGSQYREAVDRFIGEGGDNGRYAPRGYLDREDDRNMRSNWDEDEGRGSSASRRRAADYDDEDRHPGGRNDDYPDNGGDFRHASRGGSRRVDSHHDDFGTGR